MSLLPMGKLRQGPVCSTWGTREKVALHKVSTGDAVTAELLLLLFILIIAPVLLR